MKVIDEPISSRELEEHTIITDYMVYSTQYSIGDVTRLIQHHDLVGIVCPNVYMRCTLNGLIREATVPKLDIVERNIWPHELREVLGRHELHITYTSNGVRYKIGKAYTFVQYEVSKTHARQLINGMLLEVYDSEEEC
jgi:hypothetical protein